MSSENITSDDTAEPSEDMATDQHDNTTDTADTAGETGNSEAARYRRRLRDTETERDALAGRLEAMQRAEAERLAARNLQNPAALWAAGTELADLLADDGTVDAGKVAAAASSAVEALGLATPRPNYVPREGHNPAAPRGNDSWADAFTLEQG